MSGHQDLFGRLADSYAGRSEPENLRPLSVLYWRLILLASVIGIGLAAAVSVTVFLRVLDIIGAPQTETPTAVPTLNRSELESMLRAYDARNARYDDLKGDGSAR